MSTNAVFQPVFGILLSAISALIIITIHEFTKALVSTQLGDRMPALHGRLNLNPLRHLEPVGFICTLLWGCGWGKPIITSSSNYKNKKLGTFLTYTMPVIVCILFGILVGFLGFLILQNNISGGTAYLVRTFTMTTAYTSVVFGLYNLLPVYPLDGAKILNLFLSPNYAVKFASSEKILQIVLIIVLVFRLLDGLVYGLASRFLFFLG